MSNGNLSAEQTNSSAMANDLNDERQSNALRISVRVFVLMLALFQLSENTVDPDLWGHVVFGQEMLHTHSIPKAEIYSWTAAGQPWINHEVIAEILLGSAHALFGGSGILLLKVAIGLLTFGLCVRLGAADLSWPARYVAWAFGALAIVEVSFGFAARPQMFTMLFLVVEIALLLQLHRGYPAWAVGLPVLFVVWINTHGGALAGFGLLILATGASTAQFLFDKTAEKPSRQVIAALWLALAGSTVALLCNPWGTHLVRWLIGSVLWMRPEISEWNPTPLGWDHAAFFILVALAVFAWMFTRLPRAWWAMTACAAFAFLGWRAVRNAPLCGLVLLALTPRHLADAIMRFGASFARSTALLHQAGIQKIAAALFVCGSLGISIATFTLHKQHPLTMEVPAAQYPIAAVEFLREHEIHGKMISFFDWGEMAIFHLPDCPPSLDGRLDTCYSRELIAAQWKFYNDESFEEKIFNPDDADLALLPVKLAGAHSLAHRPGWHVVYYDDTAVIMARMPENFPKLASLKLPVAGSSIAGERTTFADKSPRWK